MQKHGSFILKQGQIESQVSASCHFSLIPWRRSKNTKKFWYFEAGSFKKMTLTEEDKICSWKQWTVHQSILSFEIFRTGYFQFVEGFIMIQEQRIWRNKIFLSEIVVGVQFAENILSTHVIHRINTRSRNKKVQRSTGNKKDENRYPNEGGFELETGKLWTFVIMVAFEISDVKQRWIVSCQTERPCVHFSPLNLRTGSGSYGSTGFLQLRVLSRLPSLGNRPGV